MDMREACSIVEDYAQGHTGGDFLRALEELRDRRDYLSPIAQEALAAVLEAGRRMFAPVRG